MKKLSVALSVAMMLMAFTASIAAADKGIDIEVVNKTGKTMQVQLAIKSFGEEKNIDQTAGPKDSIRFYKDDTAHKDKALVPNWELTFHGDCRYIILSQDNECQPQAPLKSCANVEQLGPCSYRFTVAE